MNIPIAEAKAKFSEMIKRAESGEEVAVTRHGKIVARLVPPYSPPSRSILGMWKDREVWIADDFDELGPEWDPYVS